MSDRDEARDRFVQMIVKLDLPLLTTAKLLEAAHAWVAAACRDTIDHTTATFARHGIGALDEENILPAKKGGVE